MRAYDLASVLLKLLGIYWLAQAITLLGQGLMMPFMGLQDVQGYNWKLPMADMLLFVALYAIASYFFIFRTPAVLRFISVNGATEAPAALDPGPGYAPLAFSLLGAFFAIPAVGQVLSSLIKWVSQWQATGMNYGMFRQAVLLNVMPDLIQNLVQLIIGIVLIMGRERFGRLWKRLRPLATDTGANEQN